GPITTKVHLAITYAGCCFRSRRTETCVKWFAACCKTSLVRRPRVFIGFEAQEWLSVIQRAMQEFVVGFTLPTSRSICYERSRISARNPILCHRRHAFT